MAFTLAYIGLGSNLDNPLGQVVGAVDGIKGLPRTRLLARSHWYRSTALGPAGQPDYINGVVAVDTGLSPTGLLDALQALEARQGRRRTTHWGPRTLDLDILLYGVRTQETPRLTLPHPELKNRNFVLFPLADINPELVLPDGTPLSRLLAKTPTTGIVQLADGD